MVSWIWIVVAIAVVVVAAAALWKYSSGRRTAGLRDRFGPEYDRVAREQGPRAAESELERRQKRVEALEIRPLPRGDRERYAGSWRVVQTGFVDQPPNAVTEADHLVADLMARLGYPVGAFEQRAADISVDHPRVVQNYRAAHEIAMRNERGQATTEDLRTAMVHYRALFEELLGDRVRTAGGGS